MVRKCMVNQMSTITLFHLTRSPQTSPPLTFANVMPTTATNSNETSTTTIGTDLESGLVSGLGALNPFPPLAFANCHPFK